MNAKEIEKNELFYFSLVNQAKKGREINEYINPFVPQMYDHNFWYLKTKGFSAAAKNEVKRLNGKSLFLRFFGKITDNLQEADWKLPEISGYTSSSEQLVYMVLTEKEKLSSAQTAVEIKEVVTDEDFQAYCDYTYEDGTRISESFAEEKLRFLWFLRELSEVRFYIAVSEGKAIGSLDVYKLKDYYKIENVFVKEAFRKQGIAGSLIRLAVESREDQTAGISLATDIGGMGESLYQKLGFTEAAFEVNYLLVKDEEETA
ncbi:GNAT family N-acetyltransferase [Enterococcus sp. LJL51]|uniref:GNAT family N-acetyltransferase n=1 Tax=Enterococcus sp. LJL51 TaxID=3416656 RepID=UPI003CEE75C5